MPAACEPLLTPEELQQARSAAEMLEWVDTTAARFNTKQLRAKARLGKHCFKQLMEEARPMALFARRHYGASADVRITHVLGNQHYDAIVEDRRAVPDTVRFLEVTGTRTYEDALRLQVLNKKGHVAMLGPINKIKRGPRRGEIEVHGEVQDRDRIVGDYLPLVLGAAQDKAANPHYQADTALIISVDDHMALREPEDAETLNAYVQREILPVLAATPFVLLAIEGGRELHLAYRLR